MSDRLSEFCTRLRQQREVRGRSLRQIADSTKLGVRTLEALERGDLSRLPPAIFRRAVVRAYAREVGLDPELMVREFLDFAPDALPTPGAAAQLVVETPQARSRITSLMRRTFRMVGAIALVVSGAVYFTVRGGASPDAAADRPAVVSESSVLTLTSRPAAPEAVHAAAVSTSVPGERPVIARISVSAPCHLLITADGQTVRDGRMTAGDLVEFKWRETVEIAGSDAGAVQFSLNGQVARSFGAPSTPLLARLDRDDYQDFLRRP